MHVRVLTTAEVSYLSSTLGLVPSHFGLVLSAVFTEEAMASLKKQTHRWSATFKNVSNAATKLTGREQKSKRTGYLSLNSLYKCLKLFFQNAVRLFLSDVASDVHLSSLKKPSIASNKPTEFSTAFPIRQRKLIFES